MAACATGGAGPGLVGGEGISGLLRPDQIDTILRASRRTYRVTATSPVEPTPLAQVVELDPIGEPRRVDPFLEVHEVGGKVQLRSHLPDEAIEPIFSLAGEAFAARDFEAARRLYLRAIEARPEYFKSYTYLGNALYFLGRYLEAEAVFHRALALNPFDYQAHLFLGDTLHQLGSYRRAKDALTRAFMLNRENPVVLDRLRSTLARMHLAVREDRLVPPVRIEREGADRVTIHLDRNEGTQWYALAACLACWAYEEQCGARARPEQDPLRLAMYRECLLNQAASIAVRFEENAPITPDERALLAAIEDGFLEAIVFWEVVAPRAPVVILLLPEGLRESIVAYIERYVFVSTRVVQGEAAREPLFALR